MKNILLLMIFIALISCSKNPSAPDSQKDLGSNVNGDNTNVNGDNTSEEGTNTPESWLKNVKNKKVTRLNSNGAGSSYTVVTFADNGDITISYTDSDATNTYKFIREETPTKAIYQEAGSTGSSQYMGYIISNNKLLETKKRFSSMEQLDWSDMGEVGPLENQ